MYFNKFFLFPMKHYLLFCKFACSFQVHNKLFVFLLILKRLFKTWQPPYQTRRIRRIARMTQRFPTREECFKFTQ